MKSKGNFGLFFLVSTSIQKKFFKSFYPDKLKQRTRRSLGSIDAKGLTEVSDNYSSFPSLESLERL